MIILAKMMFGFMIGKYFGKLTANEKMSAGLSLFLVVVLTLLVCSLIDMVALK